MQYLVRLCVLTLVCWVPVTLSFGAQSDSKSYTVSFTIPAHVSLEADSKTIAIKQQLTSQQTEIRSGEVVQVRSIVVP